MICPQLRLMAMVMACGASVWMAACSSTPPKARAVDPVVRDVPQVLRGVIGSECSINGIEPVLCSGLGLVVGLNGTGGGPYPASVQATMERELARNGIGKGGPMSQGPLAGKSPRQVLADPNVSVVIVEGAIPPGAPKRAPFDVVVRTLPGAATTSLEGGTLWSTELRIGPATPFGAPRTRKLAEADGPIYVNPFAEPGSNRGEGASRTIARVLYGGRVTDPLSMEMVLDNASHARASSIVNAINSKFPPGAGDDGPIARGRSASSIALRVPRAYAERPDEFIRLVTYMPVDQAFPEEYAKRFVDEVQRQPALAEELSWSLRSLGRPALSFVPKLYEFPELMPRMAGLRAGAFLGDPRVFEPLKSLARSVQTPMLQRSEAITLLGRLGTDPQVNLFLRQMLDAPELELRVAAYEALVERGDGLVTRRVFPGRFIVDSVPSKDPLIYVTQQGQPKIVLFGEVIAIRRPSIVSAWSDRFMMAAEDEGASTGQVRVFYRDYRTGQKTTASVPADVASLVKWLSTSAVSVDPEETAGLSYSQVVGALYQVQSQGAVAAAFSTERDRLMARLLEAQQTTTAIDDRPESDADRERLAAEAAKASTRTTVSGAAGSAGQEGTGSLVVPLNPDGSVRQPGAEPKKPE